MIQVKCKTKDSLPLSALTEFQGELKIRDEEDYRKIIASITKYGFAFPFFVWKDGETNNVLDGHGRFGALKRMEAAGTKIPPLPVTYIDAKDHAEAVALLVKLNSKYGTITEAGLLSFAEGFALDFEDVELEGIDNLDDLFGEKISAENKKSAEKQDYPQGKPLQQGLEVVEDTILTTYCPECSGFYDISLEEAREMLNAN